MFEAVNRLIDANERMQQQLQSAHDRIRDQAMQIETAEKRLKIDGLTRVFNRLAFDDVLARTHAIGKSMFLLAVRLRVGRPKRNYGRSARSCRRRCETSTTWCGGTTRRSSSACRAWMNWWPRAWDIRFATRPFRWGLLAERIAKLFIRFRWGYSRRRRGTISRSWRGGFAKLSCMRHRRRANRSASVTPASNSSRRVLQKRFQIRLDP